MPTQYKIVYTGKLHDGFTSDTVIANLMSISKMEKAKAEKLLLVQKPIVIKKGLDRQKAEKFGSMFKKAGLQIKLMEDGVVEQAPTEATQASPGSPPVDAAPVEREATDSNPYAAPVADLKVQRESSGKFLDSPRKVSAAHGWHWIRSAASIFLGEPWKWSAMSLVAGLILIPLSLIPFVGSLLNTMLALVFAGGFMLAAQHQTDGKPMPFSLLFSGFGPPRNQLILVGVLYLGGIIIISVIMGLLFVLSLGVGFLPMFFGDTSSADAFIEGGGPNILMFILAGLFGAALSIPLVMAVWFTAPLVALGNRKALDAFKLSFQACLRNFMPFLIYGIVFLLIVFIFMAGIGAVTALMAFMISDSGIIIGFLPFIIMFLLSFPVMIIGGISVYTGFCDLFHSST